MIKFLHVRFVDPETGELSTHGGVTVAYMYTKKDIMVAMAQCRMPDYTMCDNWNPGDRFNYKIGRELAAGRLRSFGPLEVLTRKDPMGRQIVEWLQSYLRCTVHRDDTNPKRIRWVSDFGRSDEVEVAVDTSGVVTTQPKAEPDDLPF